MARAVFNGTVVAESDDTIVVERNHYFPPEAVRAEHVRASRKQTWCPWKGRASYLDVEAGGEVSPAAGWYYPETTAKAAHIRGRVAFWRGVTVEP